MPAEPEPNSEEPVVLVVDDDESMREALRSLLESVDLRVEMFRSATAFLQADLPDAPGCIVLDVRLPGKAASSCRPNSSAKISASLSYS
jgi:FixJ family two-component response regulator